MTDFGMTPPEGMTSERTPESMMWDQSPGVASWIAIVSIIFGALGLLCWGGQGMASMLTDMREMEAAGIEMSSGHRTLSIVGYLVNFALAIMLIAAGTKALSGSGCLLRLWANLKLLAVVLGVVVAYAYFDEMISMMSGQMEQSIAEQSKAATAQGETPPEMDAETRASLGIGAGIGMIVVISVVQLIWPIIVLSCVKKHRD